MADIYDKHKINYSVKKEVKRLKAYEVEKVSESIKLDANEIPYELPEILKEKFKDVISYNTLNRYPDARAMKLCAKLAEYVGNGITGDMVIVGNGSDELINIIISTFLNKESSIILPTPSFSMYNIYASINEAHVIEFEGDEKFNLNIDSLIDLIELKKPELVFLCNPNNPTGNLIERKNIIKLIENAGCMVVVDEAYFEFCGETVVDLVNRYNNLIVLRTMSKAWGLAGLRLGYLISNQTMIYELLKVKAPYNVNTITQEIAYSMLDYRSYMESNVESILTERKSLIRELKAMKNIHVFDTNANFILLRVSDADMFTNGLKEYGISIRNLNRNSRLKDCVRISVGKEEENKNLIIALKAIVGK